MWQQENLCTFKDFLRQYNNKDVLPALEAFQKMGGFYVNEGVDILNFGCTLPNLAISCLHKSTTAKFYHFTESETDLLENLREDMVDGPSTVYTRKVVVDETFERDSTNFCKSIVGNDASQLYPFSMCRAMPTVCSRNGS